jgi:hypothetical protein
MLTLVFRYEPTSAEDNAREKFISVIFSWGNLQKSNKLKEIFRGCVHVSALIVSQNNMIFEIKLTEPDETWTPSSISSEDLAIALELDSTQWTISRMW